MGRLAQATRTAKSRLRSAAQDAKALQGSMQADQLKATQAFLARARRQLPPPKTVQDLLDDIRTRWDPPDPAEGGKPGRTQDTGDGKKEILRSVVLDLKRAHKVVKQIVDQAKQGNDVMALLQQPAMALMRAPAPTARFTSGQMDETVGLILLLAVLIERYAKRMKPG